MSVDDMRLELDLTPAELAGIFTAKGWQIGGTQCPYPLPEELSANISNLIELLTETDPTAEFATLGRVVVYRDADFPEDVEIALVIGRAMRPLGFNADVPGSTDGGSLYA